MRSLRAILFAAFAVLFVVSTNRCVIAAAFPDVKGGAAECCLSEKSTGESERSQPCSENDCAPCVTLDSGVNLASLVPLVLPVPVWTEAGDLAELMKRLAAVVAKESCKAPPDPAAIPPPPWCDVMMKALPVRGPSLVA